MAVPFGPSLESRWDETGSRGPRHTIIVNLCQSCCRRPFRRPLRPSGPPKRDPAATPLLVDLRGAEPQPQEPEEDVNGEKLTVKKWWIFGADFFFSRFGADFFTVYADFSRFIRDINGEKKTSRY